MLLVLALLGIGTLLICGMPVVCRWIDAASDRELARALRDIPELAAWRESVRCD